MLSDTECGDNEKFTGSAAFVARHAIEQFKMPGWPDWDFAKCCKDLKIHR
jgi:hypothetical protein